MECRLGPEQGPVDLSVCLNKSQNVPALTSRLSPGHRRAFIENWPGKEKRKDSPASSLWLEFDLKRPAPPIPEPVLCVRLNSKQSPSQLVGEFFPRFLGRKLPSTTKLRIESLLDNIPLDSKLLYLFDLSARGRDVIRLEIFSHRLDSVTTFLDQAVSRGSSRQISAVAPVVSDGDRFHLSVDIEEGTVGPRIGLEVSYFRWPGREPRWTTLLHRLIGASLCSREKASAVLAWPGYATPISSHTWPLNTSGYCVRSLSHLKISTWPSSPPSAKAYLLFQYLPKHPRDQRQEVGSPLDSQRS